jgi:multiple sugar transport system permease protein
MPALRRDDPAAGGPEVRAPSILGRAFQRMFAHAEGHAPAVFLMPAVLVVLFISVFPLIISLYLSLARIKLVRGGFTLDFVGLLNFKKLLFGSQQFHLLGRFADITPTGWLIIGVIAAGMLAALIRYGRGANSSVSGLFGRGFVAMVSLLGVVLLVRTLGGGGHPGTLAVTLIYVFIGVSVQFAAGLGLALLCTQQLVGRRFFRIVFFLPMMITPVGIAYTFRMLTDTAKGPFAPLWQFFGWAETSWVTDPWGARAAIMIGDAWQWIPFMFIVLLAALESQPRDQVEAAMVDGANRWQIFRAITWPAIVPVSITLVLIRAIEAFKIIDLPNVLTNGGPGIASESLTLHSFMA